MWKSPSNKQQQGQQQQQQKTAAATTTIVAVATTLTISSTTSLGNLRRKICVYEIIFTCVFRLVELALVDLLIVIVLILVLVLVVVAGVVVLGIFLRIYVGKARVARQKINGRKRDFGKCTSGAGKIVFSYSLEETN